MEDEPRNRGADESLFGRLQRSGSARMASLLWRARAGADALRHAGDRHRWLAAEYGLPPLHPQLEASSVVLAGNLSRCFVSALLIFLLLLYLNLLLLRYYSLYEPWTTRRGPVYCSSSAVRAKCPSEDSPSSWVRQILTLSFFSPLCAQIRFCCSFTSGDVPLWCEPTVLSLCAVASKPYNHHAPICRSASFSLSLCGGMNCSLFRLVDLLFFCRFFWGYFLLFNQPLNCFFVLFFPWFQGAMDLSDSASRRWARRRGCHAHTPASIDWICHPTKVTSSSWRRWRSPLRKRKVSVRNKTKISRERNRKVAKRLWERKGDRLTFIFTKTVQ